MKLLLDFIKSDPTETQCEGFLESIYWATGKPISPFFTESKVYKCKKAYKCQKSGRYFNVRNQTLFTDVKKDLVFWFKAIAITDETKISSYKLATKLGVTQKSAWFMLHRFKKYPERLYEFKRLVK